MKRTVIVGIGSVICILLGSLFFVFWGSYPLYSGTQKVGGLMGSVYVLRDTYGIPTIRAKHRLDVAYATGYTHAQERFFQMDLLRRMAAGELSELFGRDVLTVDKQRRLHQFRHRARVMFEQLTPEERQLIAKYVEGVNEGLRGLYCRPFEYVLLRTSPATWTEEDSLLVGLGLFFDLQDPFGDITRLRGIMQASLPKVVYEYFTQQGSVWDAPLDGSSFPLSHEPSVVRSLCALFGRKEEKRDMQQTPRMRGSNQWAVAPSYTQEGHAILACDMHLDLFVPNIWYRMKIVYTSAEGKNIEMTGVSLPGTPLLAIGSNHHIAWGFTNAYVDTTDLVTLQLHPDDSHRYLTPSGYRHFEEENEEIKVKGEASVMYKILKTRWGPVHPESYFDHPVAIRWVAHDLDAFNFRLVDLETAETVEAAFRLLDSVRLPVLNFMAVDTEGHIGWTYMGGIPLREGYLPGVPVSFADNTCRWVGLWKAQEHPKIIDPINGCLWTANNRVVEDKRLGNNYLNSIRAYQIRERLAFSSNHTIEDMYMLQLDDEAIFFRRWQTLLIDSLDPDRPKHRHIQSVVGEWDGHCSSSSEAYFWIRTFRREVHNALAKKCLASCFDALPRWNLELLDFEEAFYMMASDFSATLLDEEKGLTGIVDAMLVKHLNCLHDKPLWGLHNVAKIQHPLGAAIPLFGKFLNMPATPLSGDYYVPKVMGSSEGASVRMVISPGHEDTGILSMPCGQSGHPFSPHYRDQHDTWLQGGLSPFSPGMTMKTLVLMPYNKGK